MNLGNDMILSSMTKNYDPEIGGVDLDFIAFPGDKRTTCREHGASPPGSGQL
jgi:hypothetical protein